jgi:hypothetical protein
VRVWAVCAAALGAGRVVPGVPRARREDGAGVLLIAGVAVSVDDVESVARRWYTGLASHRFTTVEQSTGGCIAITRAAALSCAPWGSFTHTRHCRRACTTVSRCGALHKPPLLTETRLQSLQRVRDVATLIRRCWCRRDAKHTRGAYLGGRDRLPWRTLGRVGESEHTCGGVDARRV